MKIPRVESHFRLAAPPEVFGPFSSSTVETFLPCTSPFKSTVLFNFAYLSFAYGNGSSNFSLLALKFHEKLRPTHLILGILVLVVHYWVFHVGNESQMTLWWPHNPCVVGGNRACFAIKSQLVKRATRIRFTKIAFGENPQSLASFLY